MLSIPLAKGSKSCLPGERAKEGCHGLQWVYNDGRPHQVSIDPAPASTPSEH